MLHGFPESRASWRAVADLLRDAGYATFAPDQRGYSAGARPVGVDAYQLDELVADVIAICDALGLDTVHLVGHDWGAAVAWTVAARHPERISSLTAVSVPHPAAFAWAKSEDPEQRERSGYMEYFQIPDEPEFNLLADDAAALRMGFGDAVPGDVADQHVRVLSAPGAMTAALNWYRAQTPVSDDVPVVDVPTTFVWSSGDIAIARAGAERCGEFVRGDYHFIEIPDASHWLPDEHPEAIADAILSRIGRSPATTARGDAQT
ncbi:MAG: alpha/beta hydrolase [Gordonia sp. (in: high G+C Gram-positive bacteria)]|nr:MAG: alpha/beta hydrolase [Gordonia sp. (in: high G+C Gram-positive bacteria)]